MSHWRLHGGKFNFLKFNENERITCQFPWDTVKTVLRGKFIDVIT